MPLHRPLSRYSAVSAYSPLLIAVRKPPSITSPLTALHEHAQAPSYRNHQPFLIIRLYAPTYFLYSSFSSFLTFLTNKQLKTEADASPCPYEASVTLAYAPDSVFGPLLSRRLDTDEI